MRALFLILALPASGARASSADVEIRLACSLVSDQCDCSPEFVEGAAHYLRSVGVEPSIKTRWYSRVEEMDAPEDDHTSSDAVIVCSDSEIHETADIDFVVCLIDHAVDEADSCLAGHNGFVLPLEADLTSSGPALAGEMAGRAVHRRIDHQIEIFSVALVPDRSRPEVNARLASVRFKRLLSRYSCPDALHALEPEMSRIPLDSSAAEYLTRSIAVLLVSSGMEHESSGASLEAIECYEAAIGFAVGESTTRNLVVAIESLVLGLPGMLREEW